MSESKWSKVYQVSNFTGGDQLGVRSIDWAGDGENRHVVLMSHVGPCSFQFNMTPRDARNLASLLNILADDEGEPE